MRYHSALYNLQRLNGFRGQAENLVITETTRGEGLEQDGTLGTPQGSKC